MGRMLHGPRKAPAVVERNELPPSSLAAPSTKKHLWLAAIKPPMYTVAITPMTVGAASAFCATNRLDTRLALFSVLAAILAIAWVNLCNDVFDYDTGVDKHKKESVVNLLGATRAVRHVVLIVAHIFLTASFALYYSVFRNDAAPLFAVAFAVFEGWIYQSPPFRLGYKGLGELLCFTAFFIATTAAYYSQALMMPNSSLLLSERVLRLFSLPLHHQPALCAASLVALATTFILFCSHFHQIRDDAAVGKLSPIVRLGTFAASRVLCVAVALFCVLQTYFFYINALPLMPFILSLFAFPLLFNLAWFVCTFHDRPSIVRVSKYKAVVFHFVHGMLLTLGYLLQAFDVVGHRNTA
eukprot:TRINITY_DN3886_c0_g1_i1.p1 TRINITY_DN3886_c0_g1~~TRINITY_DN3886_c0_g1_i1.p1  ORF type:complete len:354 (+),score=56.18 TRINITY_DN3886_c0_g1_i1:252-1313(+)